MDKLDLKCAVCDSLCEKKCTGCGAVAYCNKEHQKQHWPTHKIDCKPCWTLNFEPNRGRQVFQKKQTDFVDICIYFLRFVVATRNIKAGELVMGAEKPSVIGPHTVNPPPVCLGCFFPIHFVRERLVVLNAVNSAKGCVTLFF